MVLVCGYVNLVVHRPLGYYTLLYYFWSLIGHCVWTGLAGVPPCAVKMIAGRALEMKCLEWRFPRLSHGFGLIWAEAKTANLGSAEKSRAYVCAGQEAAHSASIVQHDIIRCLGQAVESFGLFGHVRHVYFIISLSRVYVNVNTDLEI